ncbi:MAG: threonine/serine dehydratase [Alicyclobacillus sp.]|nr:threonine/serine dehydratase [Alicyclobacillus sp.]
MYPPVTRSEIEVAQARLRDRVQVTPLLYAPALSAAAGMDVYLKCENLQITGSFKVRGALNMILALCAEGQRPAGVVTASSGNHGQAVAYAARQAGLPCTVVVPETVVAVKERAIQALGARVVRCGTTSSARLELAQQLAEDQGLVYIPPYDHPLIVAGQGTIGLEVLAQCPQVQTVVVPVGGGGLISGIATAMKQSQAQVRVVGVEPELARDTFLSRQTGQRVDIGTSHTVADGLRSSQPGEYTFAFVERYVDELVLVPEADITGAAVRLLADHKLVAEPSGAVSAAAVQAKAEGRLVSTAPQLWTGPVVCIVSGGNVDWALLAQWLLAAEGLERF